MIEWAQKNHYPFEFLAKKDTNNGKNNYFRVSFVLNEKKIIKDVASTRKKLKK